MSPTPTRLPRYRTGPHSTRCIGADSEQRWKSRSCRRDLCADGRDCSLGAEGSRCAAACARLLLDQGVACYSETGTVSHSPLRHVCRRICHAPRLCITTSRLDTSGQASGSLRLAHTSRISSGSCLPLARERRAGRGDGRRLCCATPERRVCNAQVQCARARVCNDAAVVFGLIGRKEHYCWGEGRLVAACGLTGDTDVNGTTLGASSECVVTDGPLLVVVISRQHISAALFATLSLTLHLQHGNSLRHRVVVERILSPRAR